MITPAEYLKSLGIELNKTVLITFVDGAVRSPDIISLLEGYLSASTGPNKLLGTKMKGDNEIRIFQCSKCDSKYTDIIDFTQ